MQSTQRRQTVSDKDTEIFLTAKKPPHRWLFHKVLRNGLLHQINDSFESCWVVHSQVGKYFAVEFDATGV